MSENSENNGDNRGNNSSGNSDNNNGNNLKRGVVPLLKKLKNRFYKDKNDADIYRRIFNLTWPSFIELFLSSLFGAVDLVMVGQLSPSAIAGVGLTNQPFFLLISVFAAVNVGTTTLVSWSVGSGDKKKASVIVKQAVLANMFAGVVLSLIGISLSGFVMQNMAEDYDTVMYATSYFRIVCFGLMFQAVNMGITSALRGCGLTRIPMIYNLAANGVNVILNYVLIYGHFGFPEMGVDGAAWATTISRIIGCAAALGVVIFSRQSMVKLHFKTSWKPDFKIISDMFSIGLPAAGEQFVIQSGLMIFSRIVSELGVNAYAAHQVCASINSLAFSVSQAFSVSTTTMVGQAVGADEYDKAEKYTLYTRRIARFITFIIAMGFVFFGKYLAMLYTNEPEVIELCVPIFYFIALIQYIQSSQMSTAGALRGAGDTMYPLYASIAGIWFFRVVLSLLFILVFGWGLIGAWLSFFLDQCMRSFVIKVRFNSGKWREIKALKEARSKA